MNKVKLPKKKSSIAFLALYYWTKCLGINPLLLSESGDLETTRCGLFYNCFLSTTFCYIFYEATKTRLHLQLTHEAPIAVILDYIGLLFQFNETLSTWINFGLFQRRTIVLLKDFIKMEKLSEKLENNTRVQGNQILYYLFIVNFVYLTTIIISNVMWNFWPNYRVTIWIVFYVPTLASYNCSMLYLLGLLIVKRKFRLLNRKLRDLVENEPKNNCVSDNCDALSNKMMTISQLHRELRNIVDRMGEHMGLPVLLNIGNNFIYLTISLYSCYRYFMPLESSVAPPTYVFIMAIGHWILRPIIIFLLISNVSGSTLEEANNTGNLLHATLNNCQVHEKSRKYWMVRNLVGSSASEFHCSLLLFFQQFSLFSLDLLNNHLNISILGFFKLDHFFFYSLIATSTSYLVIMHQLSTE